MNETSLKERYYSTLALYVKDPNALGELTALGRELVGDGVKLEEIAKMQREALERAIEAPEVDLKHASKRMAEAQTALLVAYGNECERRLEQQERIHLGLQLSPDSLVVLDADHCIVDMNPAFLRLQGGKERHDLIGKAFIDLFVSSQHRRVEQALSEVAKIGWVDALELEMRTLDQRRVFVELTASMIRGPDRLPAGTVAILRDASVRRRREQRRKHRQSQVIRTGTYHAVGELAAGVAHEINNPLSGVLTYAFLLNERIAGLPPEVQSQLEDFPEHLDRIKVAAERCRSIAENLLTFARQTDKQKQMVSLSEVWQRTAQLLGFQIRKQKVQLTVDIGDGLTVWGNLSQLQQVMTNIVLNAIQVMGEGGEIDIRAKEDERRVVVTISDTGPGIAAELVPRIFEPFYTTKPPGQGTGLGLSIVYGIVQNHGGEISADSVEGQGTTVRVALLKKPPPSEEVPDDDSD